MWERELFPLPLPHPELSPDPHAARPYRDQLKHLSRSVQRRVLRHVNPKRWANDAVATCNELSGAPFESIPLAPLSKSQAECIDHVTSVFESIPSPPTDLTPAGALSELCGFSSRYEPTPTVGVAAYEKDLVSWPPSGSVPANVLDHLADADAELIGDWATHVLKDAGARSTYRSSAARPRPFLEPSLVRRPQVYAEFLLHLHRAGMLSWRVGGESLLGIFFVAKKSGKLRIILDTRDINGFFKDPPGTRLPSGAAFGALETWPLASGEEDRAPLFFSGGDIADCFYHCRVPDGLEQWFSLPLVPARYLRDIRVDNAPAPRGSLLVPLLTVLPMGWSWSLHIAQKMHECCLDRVGLDPRSRIVDRKATGSLGPSDLKHAAYVDNYLVISSDRGRSIAAATAAQKELTDSNLPVHEIFEGETQLEFCGLFFDGTAHEIRLSWRRTWRLKLAIDHLLALGSCSGEALEKVIGHCTWAALLRRESLCLFNACYRFCRVARGTKMGLWGGSGGSSASSRPSSPC